jgi:hypothetical protein
MEICIPSLLKTKSLPETKTRISRWMERFDLKWDVSRSRYNVARQSGWEHSDNQDGNSTVAARG